MAIDDHDHHRHCVQTLLSDFGAVDNRGLELVRLLALVANQCDAAAAEALRTKDLSGPRFVLLMRLLGEELYGGQAEGISPTDLSRYQQVSKNTISALLRGLEEHGLIERTLDPDDRRAFRIRVSAAGRALVRTTAPEHLAFMNDLVGDLSTDERAQLTRLLDKLHLGLLRRGIAPRPPVPPVEDAADHELRPVPDLADS